MLFLIKVLENAIQSHEYYAFRIFKNPFFLIILEQFQPDKLLVKMSHIFCLKFVTHFLSKIKRLSIKHKFGYVVAFVP